MKNDHMKKKGITLEEFNESADEAKELCKYLDSEEYNDKRSKEAQRINEGDKSGIRPPIMLNVYEIKEPNTGTGKELKYQKIEITGCDYQDILKAVTVMIPDREYLRNMYVKPKKLYVYRCIDTGEIKCEEAKNLEEINKKNGNIEYFGWLSLKQIKQLIEIEGIL